MADLIFNKVPNKDVNFNQKQFYEDNFEKVKVFGQGVDVALGNKVDKVTGKGLTKNEFTDGDKLLLNTTIPAQLGEIATKQGLLTGLLTTAKTSIVSAINELFTDKANKVQESWTIPTLLNNFIHYGGIPIVYKKSTTNLITISGAISGGINGNACFTLPVGYRPLNMLRFSIISNGVPAYAYILANGNVVVGTGSNYWHINISFYPD